MSKEFQVGSFSVIIDESHTSDPLDNAKKLAGKYNKPNLYPIRYGPYKGRDNTFQR